MRSSAVNDVCDFETKIRKSSRGLLDLLREHHDYAIPAPAQVPKLEVVTDEWIERQKLIPLDPPPKPFVASLEKPRLTILDIQRACAKHYCVTVNDIVSGRRDKLVIVPRQVAMYLSRRLTTNTLPQISERFGKRDHTTAIHGVAKITRLLPIDAQLAADVDVLISALGGDVE